MIVAMNNNCYVKRLFDAVPRLARYFMFSFRKVVEELELDIASANVLMFLRRGQEHFSQCEICDFLTTSASVVSRFVDEIEKRGFVVRTIDAENRRKNIVALTDVGKEKAEALEKRANEIYDEMLSCLGEDERAELFNVIEKMVMGIEGGKKNGTK
jgi:DNA-binding MarR family transcriptional regulator